MSATSLVKKYGRMEAREHHLPVKTGERLASDHLKEYGPDYYKRLAGLEKRLKQK